MRPVPPICPFCNQVPDIDALCYFNCDCDSNGTTNGFSGEFKLIDIDNIDKGYEITWFCLSKVDHSGKMIIWAESRERRSSIMYNKEQHYTYYPEGQDVITILQAKKILDKYWKMKAFL